MAADLLVSSDWLAEHLSDRNLGVVDMRGSVVTTQVAPGVEQADYRGARAEYLAGHIPGAIYVDWTKDITDPNDPVPVQIAPPDRFAEVMAGRGIGDETLVIAADHTGGQFATRLWWALTYYGHDQVRVLDGGWKKWVKEGRPVETGEVNVPRASFTPRVRPNMRVTAEQLAALLDQPDRGWLLADARDAGQYTAAKRRGPRGGRIPGALHVPRELFFAPGEGFLPLEEVRARVSERGLRADRRTVAYCNGGVAATVVLFNLARLGFTDFANYDGSWNEWSGRLDLPIAD